MAHMQDEAAVVQWGRHERGVRAVSGITAAASISAGGTHAGLLTQDGQVMMWGSGKGGQLGLSKLCTAETPTAVHVGESVGKKVQKLVCGPVQTAAITRQGELYMWGILSQGPVYVPQRQSLPGGMVVVDVAMGPAAIVVLLAKEDNHTERSVWTWGYSSKGQLGLGEAETVEEPTQVRIPFATSRPPLLESVSMGETHAVVMGGGLVWMWGTLGDVEVNVTHATPVSVSLPPGETVRSIVAGCRHTLAICHSGKVLSWGQGRHGVLGVGDVSVRLQPQEVRLPAEVRIVSLMSGGMHTVAIDSHGGLWAWGDGRAFKVSAAHEEDDLLPVAVPVTSHRPAVQVACGSAFSLALLGSPTAEVHYGKRSVQLSADRLWTRKAFLEEATAAVGKQVDECMLLDERGYTILPSSLPLLYCSSKGSAVHRFFAFPPLSKEEGGSEELVLSPGAHSVPLLATKDALVAWLCLPGLPCDALEDSFFLLHDSLGLEACELMDSLVLRYYTATPAAVPPHVPHSVMVGASKVRVLQLVYRWIATDIPAFRANERLVGRVTRFLSGEPLLCFPDATQAILQLVAGTRTVPAKVCDWPSGSWHPRQQERKPSKRQANVARLSSSPSAAVSMAQMLSRAEAMNVQAVAEHFCLVDEQMFADISMEDWRWLFVATRTEADTDVARLPLSLRTAAARVMRVCQWTSQTVLLAVEERRVRVMERLLALVAALRSLRNFGSAAAIMVGLAVPTVLRLNEHWLQLSPTAVETFRENWDLVNPADSFSACFRACEAAEEPKLPFLFSLIDVMWTQAQPMGQGKLVNMKACLLAGRVIRMARPLCPSGRYDVYLDVGLIQSVELLATESNHEELCQRLSMAVTKTGKAAVSLRTLAPEADASTADSLAAVVATTMRGGVMRNQAFSGADALNIAAATLLTFSEQTREQQRCKLWESWITRLRHHDERILLDKQLVKASEALGANGRLSALRLCSLPFHTFQETFLQSEALAKTIDSVLQWFPSDQSLAILHKLLSMVLAPSTNTTALLQLLRALSELSLLPRHRQVIVTLVESAKSNSLQWQESFLARVTDAIGKARQDYTAVTARLADVGATSDRHERAARLQEQLRFSARLVQLLATKRRLLATKLGKIQEGTNTMNSKELQETLFHLTDGRSKFLRELREVREERDSMEGRKVHEGYEKVHRHEMARIVKLKKRQQEVMRRLEEVRNRIDYSASVIAASHTKLQSLSERISRDLASLQQKHRSFETGQESVQQFAVYMEQHHAETLRRMRERQEAIGEELASTTPDFLFSIDQYLTQQIDVLMYLKASTTSVARKGEADHLSREVVDRCLEESEATSHRLKEVLSSMTQSAVYGDSVEKLILKLNRRATLHDSIRALDGQAGE